MHPLIYAAGAYVSRPPVRCPFWLVQTANHLEIRTTTYTTTPMVRESYRKWTIGVVDYLVVLIYETLFLSMFRDAKVTSSILVWSIFFMQQDPVLTYAL